MLHINLRSHCLKLLVKKCSSLHCLHLPSGWHRTQFFNLHSGITWWRHQMETFSTLLAFCAGNSPVTGEFPAQRPVTQSFDVFFDLRLNTRLSKQSWDWCYETLPRSLWRHCNKRCPRIQLPTLIHGCFHDAKFVVFWWKRRLSL